MKLHEDRYAFLTIINLIHEIRACLKNVNMSNRRVFCPLDGAVFP